MLLDKARDLAVEHAELGQLHEDSSRRLGNEPVLSVSTRLSPPRLHTYPGLVRGDIDADHLSPYIVRYSHAVRAERKADPIAIPPLLREIGVPFWWWGNREVDIPPVNPLEEVERVAQKQRFWEWLSVPFCPPLAQEGSLALPL